MACVGLWLREVIGRGLVYCAKCGMGHVARVGRGGDDGQMAVAGAASARGTIACSGNAMVAAGGMDGV